MIYLCQGHLCNFFRSTYQVLVWMARANAIIQVKTQFCLVEGTLYLAWYYLVLFLIGSLFFVFIAFKRYHMVNSSTFQYLLGVFGLILLIKGPVQRQFELLQTKPKVCLVKYLTT